MKGLMKGLMEGLMNSLTMTSSNETSYCTEPQSSKMVAHATILLALLGMLITEANESSQASSDQPKLILVPSQPPGLLVLQVDHLPKAQSDAGCVGLCNRQ